VAFDFVALFIGTGEAEGVLALVPLSVVCTFFHINALIRNSANAIGIIPNGDMKVQ